MEQRTGRTYTQLESSMSKKDFEIFRKRIAKQYATSNNEFARSYFTKEYNITVSCYYKILDSVIIENLVDEEMVSKMEEKALANQKEHARQAGLSTRRHYQHLRRMRQEQKEIAEWKREEIEKLAINFADSLLSIQTFCKEKQIAIRIFTLLLEKAIVENIVTDTVFQKIRNRSIERASERQKERTKNYFIGLTKKRNVHKKKQPS